MSLRCLDANASAVEKLGAKVLSGTPSVKPSQLCDVRLYACFDSSSQQVWELRGGQLRFADFCPDS